MMHRSELSDTDAVLTRCPNCGEEYVVAGSAVKLHYQLVCEECGYVDYMEEKVNG